VRHLPLGRLEIWPVIPARYGACVAMLRAQVLEDSDEIGVWMEVQALTVALAVVQLGFRLQQPLMRLFKTSMACRARAKFSPLTFAHVSPA
jgi:hypothetical protein